MDKKQENKNPQLNNEYTLAFVDPKNDYYNFDYAHIQAALNKHMPALIEVIQDMTNDLMWLKNNPFNENGDMIAPTPFNEDTGDWIDQTQADNAHKSIVRQLISLLDNCQPPVYDPVEWPFLTRQDLTPEYAKQHFQEIAESGHDASEKLNEAALEIIFAEMKERQANAPTIDNEAIEQAIVSEVKGLIYSYDMTLDRVMAKHPEAKFVSNEGNPNIKPHYENHELYKAVMIATSKEIAKFYRDTLPKTIEAFNAPFIFPQDAIVWTKNVLRGQSGGKVGVDNE